MRKFIAALSGVLLAAGCGYPPTEIKPVEVKQAIPIPEGANAKPFMLSNLVFRIPSGEDLGRRLGGGNCRAVRGRINWNAGNMHQPDDERGYAITFIETMKQANYPVLGDPDALFDEDSQSRAELKVGAQIDKLQIEPCFNKDDHDDYNYGSGTAAMRINWQVFDIIAHRVVYKVTTEGFFHTEQSQTNGEGVLLGAAFQAAVINLQADPGFNALVMGRVRTIKSAQEGQPYIRLRAPAQPPANIPDAQSAVISITNATGLGSGFIISPDGYALTNAHVVGESKFVTVRLASGREVTAEVMRTDVARDVALIQLGEANLPSLKLRLNSEPDAGDEIYAIGTPLEIGLAQTVTHGIVSAYRDYEGFKFIQGDIIIRHGNSGGPLLDRSMAVVGLTDLGLTMDDSTPICLFIPIADALRRLKIELSPSEQSFRMQ
jgi:S1-C subfamily serine protease